MYHTIYKTTCLINGKFYIGKHQTRNLDDGYFGSGKYLRYAVNKHGIENFVTEIIAVYETEREMNLAEKILVVCDPEVSYNLCSGGRGGFGYLNTHKNRSSWSRKGALFINSSGLSGARLGGASSKMKRVGIHRPDRVGKIGFCAPEISAKLREKARSEEAIIKRKLTYKKIGHQQGAKNSNYGKPRPESVKAKIRASVLARKLTLPSANG